MQNAFRPLCLPRWTHHSHDEMDQAFPLHFFAYWKQSKTGQWEDEATQDVCFILQINNHTQALGERGEKKGLVSTVCVCVELSTAEQLFKK